MKFTSLTLSLIYCLLFAATCASAQDFQYATICNGQTLNILSNQTVKVVSACTSSNSSLGGYLFSVTYSPSDSAAVTFPVAATGATIGTYAYATPTSANPLIFTGPATLAVAAGPAYAALSAIMTTTTISSPGSIIGAGLPSTAVVIPSESTGPVTIILESSTDLVTWTPALPGTYGASSTNRFFRVRAQAQ